MESINKYAPLWGDWQIDSFIKNGNLGKVYKIKKQENNQLKFGAAKLVSISWDDVKETSPQFESITDADIVANMKGIAVQIGKRIQLMKQMASNQNIIEFTDVSIFSHNDNKNYDIIFKMEYLPTLEDAFIASDLSEKDVVKMALDVLNALVDFSDRKIIHRKIMPSNIFIDDGIYKIGEFGFLKPFNVFMKEKGKETHTYSAPEVVRNGSNNETLPTYSLGLVMYQGLNNNLLPFQTEHNSQSLKNAVAKRINGDTLTGLPNTIPPLNDVILKACSFMPGDRYDTPAEMIEDLNKVLAELEKPKPEVAVKVPETLGANLFSEAFEFDSIDFVDELDIEPIEIIGEDELITQQVTETIIEDNPKTNIEEVNLTEPTIEDNTDFNSSNLIIEDAPEASSNNAVTEPVVEDIKQDIPKDLFTDDLPKMVNNEFLTDKTSEIDVVNPFADNTHQSDEEPKQTTPLTSIDEFDFTKPSVKQGVVETQSEDLFADDNLFSSNPKKDMDDELEINVNDSDLFETAKNTNPFTDVSNSDFKRPEQTKQIQEELTFDDDFNLISDQNIQPTEPKKVEDGFSDISIEQNKTIETKVIEVEDIFSNDFTIGDVPTVSERPVQPTETKRGMDPKIPSNDLFIDDMPTTTSYSPAEQETVNDKKPASIDDLFIDDTPITIPHSQNDLSMGSVDGSPKEVIKPRGEGGRPKQGKRPNKNNGNIDKLPQTNLNNEDNPFAGMDINFEPVEEKPKRKSFFAGLGKKKDKEDEPVESTDLDPFAEFEQMADTNKKPKKSGLSGLFSKDKQQNKVDVSSPSDNSVDFDNFDTDEFLQDSIGEDHDKNFLDEIDFQRKNPYRVNNKKTSDTNSPFDNEFPPEFENISDSAELNPTKAKKKGSGVRVASAIFIIIILAGVALFTADYMELLPFKLFSKNETEDPPVQTSTPDPAKSGNLSPDDPITTPSDDVMKKYTFTDENGDIYENISKIENKDMVEELNIADVGFKDLSSLKDFTNLQKLSISENAIGDIEPLSGLTELRELSITGNTINDLSPLADLKNLDSLTLSKNLFTDISVIKNLSKLTSLDISDNTIESLEPLKDLTSLEQLFLSKTSTTDISHLAGLINITYLDLDLNSIQDLTPLSDIKRLSTLIMNRNQITDISSLSSLTDLKTLELSGNGINDISALANLTKLQELLLENNTISKIDDLLKLEKLVLLDLTNTGITDISAIKDHVDLLGLRLGTNNLASIEPLNKLKNLQTLDISNTGTNNIDVIINLDNLEMLLIGNNPVSMTTSLTNSKKLELLFMNNTLIEDLENLENLENLKTLSLNNTAIQDLSPIKNLTNLETLYIVNVPISDTVPIESMESLKSLVIGGDVNESAFSNVQTALPDLIITKK